MTEQAIPRRDPLVVFPPEEMAELIGKFTPDRIATFLDVTDLKADTLGPKMNKLADWAKSLGCPSVCVNPVEGSDILPSLLAGSEVKECYVMDFPLGKSDIEMKAAQTAHTIKTSRGIRDEGKGLIEIDMVINVGRFKKDPTYTAAEIEAVVEAADGEYVKVIVRSAELNEEELYAVSEVVADSRAHFIKNSTGMDAFGAFPEHIRIMREVVGTEMGVKAAGGISDAMTVMRLMYAGAREESLQRPERFRIGTSAPLNIVSTMGWLAHCTEDWVAAGINPCKICPYHHTEKQRREERELSNRRCRDCIYREHLKHRDL